MDYLFNYDSIKVIYFTTIHQTINSFRLIDNLENYITKNYTIITVTVFTIKTTITIRVNFGWNLTSVEKNSIAVVNLAFFLF